MTSNQRIKHALYLEGWAFVGGDHAYLVSKAQKVIPSEYEVGMKGHLFCPVCKTSLHRVPHDKPYFTNGRDAYFGHLSSFDHIPCVLRARKPLGKRYNTEEEARRAIEREDLIVIHSFKENRPELPEDEPAEYDATPVEDEAGPLIDAAISRHDGESFSVPSRITTVLGICRNFDRNYSRYYIMPTSQQPIRLDGLLHSVEDIEVPDDTPRLYYGKVSHTFNMGQGASHNIRMNRLKCHPNVQDFTFKATVGDCDDRGLNEQSRGRILLMFGKVTASGMGLSIERVGWGGFALLPERYQHLLDH